MTPQHGFINCIYMSELAWAYVTTQMGLLYGNIGSSHSWTLRLGTRRRIQNSKRFIWNVFERFKMGLFVYMIWHLKVCSK